MVTVATLTVQPREERGKGAARKLRQSGRVPGAMYGHGEEPRAISVDALELEKLLSSISAENTLIDVEVEGAGSSRALIREVQTHPFKPLILHVDFYQVHAGESLRLDLPVRVVGNPVGVRESAGVLQVILHDLHVECLPKDIPDAVEVNVEALDIGDSVHVRDITVENVEILNDADQVVCTVTHPTSAALPVEPESEADVQPELLRRSGEGADDVPTTEQG